MGPNINEVIHFFGYYDQSVDPSSRLSNWDNDALLSQLQQSHLQLLSDGYWNTTRSILYSLNLWVYSDVIFSGQKSHTSTKYSRIFLDHRVLCHRCITLYCLHLSTPWIWFPQLIIIKVCYDSHSYTCFPSKDWPDIFSIY